MPPPCRALPVTPTEERCCCHATVKDITPYHLVITAVADEIASRLEPLIARVEKLVDTISAGDVSKSWGTLQIPDKDGTEIQLVSPQTTYKKKPEIQHEAPETNDNSAAEIQPVSPLLSKVLTVSPQKSGADYMEMEMEKENSSPADESLDEDNAISTTGLNSDRDHVRPMSPGYKFPEKLAESLRIMQKELAQVSTFGNAACRIC